VVRPGDWVFGDIDGVVVVPAEMAETGFTKALEKARGENKVREELARGRKAREVFDEYGIL
jgi:regulator of RNase E activity RraA